MRRRLTLAIAALVLTAATAPWQWTLPAGMRAPRVPADNPMSAAKVELGRRLFYDADLSADGTMACATCHEQRRAFADGNTTHAGVHGDPGRRNVPGLGNVGWMTPLTWADPRLTTLEAQAVVPVTGTTPVEMGMAGQESEIARRLARDACYRAMFARAFPGDGAIDFPHAARALAAFERVLISLDSPYDAWMRGDRAALPPAATAGAALFRRDCGGCHSGPLLSDGRFHRILPASPADPGLAERSGRAADAGRFRTPSLRNVALTAPYFHDGSARTMADAITRHPGKAAAPAADLAALTAFLTSLTDRRLIADKDLALPDRACGKPL